MLKLADDKSIKVNVPNKMGLILKDNHLYVDLKRLDLIYQRFSMLTRFSPAKFTISNTKPADPATFLLFILLTDSLTTFLSIN